jgi:hypothetical protein
MLGAGGFGCKPCGSGHLQAVHQSIGMAEETGDHKNLGNLRIGVTELLHGSSVKLQSSVARIERRHHHRHNFFCRGVDTAAVHDGLILLPVGF